jgi:hypothetical protein
MKTSTRPTAASPVHQSLWKRQSIVVALLLITYFLGSYGIQSPAAAGAARKSGSLISLPHTIASWREKEMKVDPKIFEWIQPDAILRSRYTLPPAGEKKSKIPAAEVETVVIYSRDWRAIHSPLSCYSNGGWTITDQETRKIRRGDRTLEINVLKANWQGEQNNQIYFFTDTGQAVSGWLPVMLHFIGARLLRRSTGALKVQIGYDRRCEQANGRFTPEFLALAFGIDDALRQSLGVKSTLGQSTPAQS